MGKGDVSETMKKVKITVLKVAFYEDLAKEYGVEGLAPCSIMKEGQVFLLIEPGRKDSVMGHGDRFTSMFLRLPMGAEEKGSSMMTG